VTGHRRRPGVPSFRFRGLRRPAVPESRTASSTSTPASATSAPSRIQAPRASPPRC
jgi:hypothetical protein